MGVFKLPRSNCGDRRLAWCQDSMYRGPRAAETLAFRSRQAVSWGGRQMPRLPGQGSYSGFWEDLKFERFRIECPKRKKN